MLKNLAFYFLPLAVVLARGKVEVKMTPAMGPYCHIIRFPQGWIYPILATGPSWRPYSYDYDGDYEFRADGTVGTKFLISGVNILSSRANDQFYTKNQYEIDLSDPNAVPQPASSEAWQAAKTIPLSRKDLMERGPFPDENALFRFREHSFDKSGKSWSFSRSSPDQTWLVFQSWTGTEHPRCSGDFDFFCPGRYRGKLFWDIYDASNQKILTIKGTYIDVDPIHAGRGPAWLTDRYFIIALGEHRERCLVCEFGQRRTDETVPAR